MKNTKYILGIQSYANHDSGAAILKFDNKNKILDYVAISEERLLRQKYPYTFPLLSIKYCLEYFKLKNLSHVNMIFSDWIREKQWLRSGPSYNYQEFDYIKEKLNFNKKKIYQINHHLAHAASVFYTSGFKESAILIVDGNGSDLETQTFFYGKNNKIKTLDQGRYHGIGALYTAVSKEILNFGTGGEGKTMGLAPYGTKKYIKVFKNFEVKKANINFEKIMKRMPYSDVLNSLSPKFRPKKIKFNFKKANKNNVFSKDFASWAFAVQDLTEKVMIKLGKEIKKKTKSNNICLAGGVALNCISNQKLYEKNKFKNISVFPACSDAGIPFGLCLWGYYNYFGGKKKINFDTAYTGKKYSINNIKKTLNKYKINFEITTSKNIAELISKGKILGYFSGKSEYGPRALGNRSILADSRSKKIRDYINKYVKHRELFRPFAPIILENKSKEFFNIDYSPFMLRVAKSRKHKLIPSAVHIDNTARVQTLNNKQNKNLYNIINEFYKLTNVPCILNTSFNDKGEPLVETPEDAIICSFNTKIDYLVFDNIIINTKQLNKLNILKKLKIERNLKIKRNLKIAKKIFTKNFSQKNLMQKIILENEKAKKYVLERPFQSYHNFFKNNYKNKETGKSLIIGSNDHTRILLNFFSKYIKKDKYEYFELEDNDFSKFKKTINLCKIKKLNKLSKYKSIIISTFEYSHKFENYKNFFCPYDSSSRSIIDYYLIKKNQSVNNAKKI